MRMTLPVNGFDVEARYDNATVETVLLPLLAEIGARARAVPERLIVFLAAPPATGKSTLAAFLERLAVQTPELPRIQAVPMDGFHFHQDYILSHTVTRGGEIIPMKRVKGAPDTFDVEKLRRTLLRARHEDVLWPGYDRRLHDVVEDATAVTAPALLVEGNWLLYDAPGWRGLPHDFSIFIEAREALLRERLIARKMRGGLSREEAKAAVAVGLCSVNHQPVLKPERLVQPGDLLSFKGRGRVRFTETGGETRKGRTFIRLLRYR